MSWYPEQDVVVLGGTRPVIHGAQNTDSLNSTIFLHAYYAMEFCPFLLPLERCKTASAQYRSFIVK